MRRCIETSLALRDTTKRQKRQLPLWLQDRDRTEGDTATIAAAAAQQQELTVLSTSSGWGSSPPTTWASIPEGRWPQTETAETRRGGRDAAEGDSVS